MEVIKMSEAEEAGNVEKMEEKAEAKEAPKKKGLCAVCPLKCKYPICLIVIAGLIIWFVLTKLL